MIDLDEIDSRIIAKLQADGRVHVIEVNPNPWLSSRAEFAMAARKAGRTYTQLIGEIVEIYSNYEFRTEVLVASVRSPMHIVQAARMGADVCTCPPSVIEACLKHPLTDIGLEKFMKDWEKSQAARG